LAGLFSIALCLQTGDIEMLRQASYAGLEPDAPNIDVFAGIARMGAGNLLPLWFCIVLYSTEQRKSVQRILLALLPYFGILSLLALRREVLVEGTVVMLILIFFAAPKGNRLVLAVTGIIIACCVIVAVKSSERWQERLFSESRYEFETGSDPRTLMLMHTPEVLMEEPLIGHGLGSYEWTMVVYFPSEVRNSEAMSKKGGGIAAHNSFSRAAVETGAIGLLGFIVMFAALGWRAVRIRSDLAGTGITLRFVAIIIFLHVGDWLFFGDGIISNTTWYFIGVLLYLDRRLFLMKTEA